MLVLTRVRTSVATGACAQPPPRFTLPSGNRLDATRLARAFLCDRKLAFKCIAHSKCQGLRLRHVSTNVR